MFLIGNLCEKNGTKFRPMNLWGSCQMGEGDDEVEDDLVLNDDRIDEDDTSDLHPWKKQVKGSALYFSISCNFRVFSQIIST